MFRWLEARRDDLFLAAIFAIVANKLPSIPVVLEFYVVRDSTTRKCTIVDTKPTTTTVVDNGTFKTRTEAETETGMKTMKVCTTN